MSLRRIIAYLDYMSFFPDSTLFEEIKGIIHYLSIYLCCNKINKWCRITRKLKNICDNKWTGYGTYKLMKLQLRHHWFQTIVASSGDYVDRKLVSFENDLRNIVVYTEKYYAVTCTVIKYKFGIKIKT